MSLRKFSNFTSAALAGIFGSAFIAQITDKEGDIKYQDFYKSSSFYFLIILLGLEIAKIKLIGLIEDKDKEIAKLQEKIDTLIQENQSNQNSQRMLERADVIRRFPFEDMTQEEEIILYALVKVADNSLDRESESNTDNLNRLQDLVDNLFRSRHRQ